MTIVEANDAIKRCFANTRLLDNAKLLSAHIIGDAVTCIIEFDNGARDSIGITEEGELI